MFLQLFSIFLLILFFTNSKTNANDLANEKLKKCCEKIPAKDNEVQCVERFCDFNAISQTNILNFVSKCEDKGQILGRMWDCASSRADHTKCCESKGVTGKCLAYCKTNNGVPTNYLDYTFCLESFNEIRDCFKQHLEKN